jgi:hypothetical protein
MPASYVKGEALFIYFSVADGSTGFIPSVQWNRLLNRVR